jgi:hypothetical protein
MKKAFDAIRSKTFSLKSKMAFAATLLTAVMLSLTGLVWGKLKKSDTNVNNPI